MAITPRIVTRNPLLLLFFSTLAILAFAFVYTCPSKTSCGASKTITQPVAQTAAVKTVNVATMQAARSAAPGWLGVEIKTLDAAEARAHGTTGVLVLALQDGRPAELAGFRANDVIVRFDGKPMSNACQLKKTVASTEAGSKVPVDVIRDGRRFTFHPTLADKNGVGGCGVACR